MSLTLPLDILELIIDHLQYEPVALKACCLTSKSLVPRTRKYLFARIEFHALKSPGVKLWKKAFPDPSSSPAHYTRSLFLYGIPSVTATDTDEGGWIRTFDNVAHLHVETLGSEGPASLVPLHRLSPTLKSLRLVYTYTPPSEILDLLCSFPLLEDLSLFSLGHNDEGGRWNIPSASPKLTGSLDITMMVGMHSSARPLCDLPCGLRFTKLSLACLVEDLEPTAELVSRCSDTLESLSISYFLPGMRLSRTYSLDLSKAGKLKDLAFRCGSPGVWWIATALQTIRFENLEQITIDLHATVFRDPISEVVHQEWLDLDCVLVQLSTSSSIRPQVRCEQGEGGKDNRCYLPTLLPEAMSGGFIDPMMLPPLPPSSSITR